MPNELIVGNELIGSKNDFQNCINGLGQTWDWNNNCWVWPYNNYTPVFPTEPKFCSPSCHVFPCNHCKKCQCGKLVLPA